MSVPIPDTEINSQSSGCCNVFIDQLTSQVPALSLFDKCPGCENKVCFHKIRELVIPTTAVSSSSTLPRRIKTGGLSSSSLAFIKLQSLLPEFKRDSDCRTFLKSVELVLKTNQGIPETEWPRVFLYTTVDQSSKEWVYEHIIETEIKNEAGVVTHIGTLDWESAKKVFTSHFQRAENTSLILKRYHGCRQLKDESVQSYGDRFQDVVREMDRPDDDSLVIDHFVHGLQSDIKQRYQDWLAMERVQKRDVGYQMDSLVKLIEVCIVYDISKHTSGAGTNGGSKSSQAKSEGKSESKSNYDKSKWCDLHKSNGHSTSECRLKGKQTDSGSSQGESKTPRDKSKVKCFACQAMGHYSSECPTKTSTSTVTATSFSAATAKRVVNPPEKLTYDGSGKQTTTTVTTKAVSLNSEMKSESVLTPSRLWFYDAARNQQYSTLIDTGAEISCIDASLAKQLNLEIESIDGKVAFASTDFMSNRIGKTKPLMLTAMAIMNVEPGKDLFVKSIQHQFELMNLDVTKHQFIIGKDLIGTLFPDNIPSSFYLNRTSNVHTGTPALCGINVVQNLIETFDDSKVDPNQLLDEMVGFGAIPPDEVHERVVVSTSSSSEEEYGKIRNEIMNDPLVLEQIEINESISGFCNLLESVVKLDVSPEFEKSGYRKQYGIPESARQAVTDQVNKWFESGKIELAPPDCPFNSSLTVATKKDAFGVFTGFRICLDTRPLNKNIITNDRFTLPYIRDVLEGFLGCQFFGEIDLSEAYLQIELHPDSRQYTAFTWNSRQYMFTGCPFGISKLPSAFQRIMNTIFADLPFTAPYLDNLPFGSISAAEHKQHLLLILQRCNQYNLKVKLSAMKTAHSEMRCLGHLLTNTGVKLSPTKLECIANYEKPKTGKQLQSFLGAVTFLRGNIRHMADITASLEAAKNVTGDLVWTEQMSNDFQLVKTAIATAPALAYPDFSKPFHIATDASNTGVGGVLYQPDVIGGDITESNIVAIVSKKLSGAQFNYPAYKKELYAIVYCLKQFHNYIWGRTDVIVFTDHKPLTHIFTQTELSPAVQQWLDVLLNYDFQLCYREGKLNVLPDHLSRLYAAEYADSPAWGVLPWKIVDGSTSNVSTNNVESKKIFSPASVAVVLIEDVSDPIVEADIQVGAEVQLNGGGNAEALENKQEPVQVVPIDEKMTSIEALIAIEKHGYTIPSDEEKLQLIQQQHALGHYGRDAVCSGLIAKKYWWPGMRNDITQELSNCNSCSHYTVVRSGFNPAGSITATAPWEHVQIDTSVHLPAAPGGFKALLVMIDVFTGFVILRPIVTTTADIIANEIWNVCCIFGMPKILQSDNGPEFVNEVIRALVKLAGIEHRFIAPYNPRCDGKVERSIQTVMSTIKKLAHGNETNWSLYVPFAQLSFNNKVASLTGSTPFSLMFGRSMNEIRDYTKINVHDGEPTLVDIENWKTHMTKVQSLIFPAILERTKNSKDKMMARLNKQRRLLTNHGKDFPTGAIVMLKDPLKSTKWEPKYVGPFVVVRRTRAGTYQLKDGTGAFLERMCPPDQLKLVSSTPRQQDLETQEFQVEYIISHRGDPGSYIYETKFKNFAIPEWIPAANFNDTHVINNYWKTQQQADAIGQ